MLGKHTLKPKEKTYLTITYTTKDRPGKFHKTVTITLDAAGNEETQISIEGTVKEAPGPKIHVTPRRVDLEAVQAGYEKEQQFTVSNTGSMLLRITKIHLKGTETVYFDGRKEGDILIEPGKSHIFTVRLRAGEGTGQVRHFIVIESNAKNATQGGYVIMIVNGGS